MRKTLLIITTLLAVAVLVGSGNVLAAEKVDRTGKASADGLVLIENIVGSITVVGWDKEEIHLEGTLGDDVKELKFETGKRKSVIEVEYDRRGRNLKDGAELLIHVPEASKVEVEGVSVQIKASGLVGEVELESVSGSVEFEGQCRELSCESVSGSVKVQGGASGMELSSISGSVHARGREADLEVETVSGSIEVEFDRLTGLEAESVSGSIDVTADLVGRGDFSCDVVNGSITFTVPDDVSASFVVSTFNGNIDNAFGQKARKTSKYTPGKELEFTSGKGEATVKLNSFNGSVRLRKK